jgi:hypothetical protein
MYRQALRRCQWLRTVIAAILLLTGLFPPAPAAAQDRKRKPVVVSFGQPNIWSLEQAHYLLARMHMANLELQAKDLTAEDLDPNVTHGMRIQILKQMFGVSAEFDQGIGFQNQRIVENARFNDSRRRDMLTRRSSMQDERLALKREVAGLELEQARLNADKSATDEQKALKTAEIESKKKELAAIDAQIESDDAELKTLNAEPSGTPTAPTPSASPFNKDSLPSTIIEKLSGAELKDLLKGSDPKLNATTKLDNTVQLQYEIIAKQLTLLRDETGPGERLVFLELPQSIYTTPGSGDEKMAQTWWHVNGYTRTDPLVRLLLELYEVEWKWKRIKEVAAFKRVADIFAPLPCTGNDEEKIEATLREAAAAAEQKAAAEKKAAPEKIDDKFGKMFHAFKCERAEARDRTLQNLFREASSDFDRVEQNGARDTSQIVEAVRKMIAVQANGRTIVPDEDSGPAEIAHSYVDKKSTAKTREQILRTRDELLGILSNPNPEVMGEQKPEYSFEQGIEFVRLDEGFGRARQMPGDIEQRTVRAVDIIPRQSSLNVNDIQDTVKATGILAAFKFLFGFAGQVSFQRQREQFEQFVHQELYASGFGKGNRDFGWTFGALPGTKRVAPGVRTTYAALIVPDDAESLVLSARGCYFPRKSYSPLDFEDTGHGDWDREGKYRSYNCGDEQTYILPIPGGGNTSNFWVTNIDYQGRRKPGEFITVSVRGNNFSSQMGVLVNGVPLFPTVGLGHPHLTPRRAAANGAAQAVVSDCAGVTDAICGRYERIDPRQIVFTFRMPDAYRGTPNITLIGPGKSVDLNILRNLWIRDGVKQDDQGNVVPISGASLSSNGVAGMFGPAPSLSITDVQVLSTSPNSPRVVALVTGTGFSETDSVYVNGEELTGAAKQFKSSSLYRLFFNPPAGDELRITMARGGETVTKPAPNPAALKITNAFVLSYEPPARKKPGVMLVRLEGSGFHAGLQPGQDAPHWQLVSASPREMVVRFLDPGPTVAVTLADTITGGSASTSVQRPTAAKKDDGKKADEKKEGEKD